MSGISNIGAAVRQLRIKSNMTLKELSVMSGLSVGYLSNLERNLSSPTLANLQKICEVLHTSVGDLLERSDEERLVIRRNELGPELYPEESLTIESIDFGENLPLFQLLELGPRGGTSLPWRHDFDEVGHVFSGVMNVRLFDSEYTLYPGDTVLVKANTPHAIYNFQDEPCLSYWCRVRAKKNGRKKKT